jgi:hypothetical protein
VGALVFCPCHLPLTIAGLTALTGAAWLVGRSALLYVGFGVAYLLVLALAARYLVRGRDREREHARHGLSLPRPTIDAP